METSIISKELLETKIHNIQLERIALKKRQAKLRVQEHRYKKLLFQLDQLTIDSGGSDEKAIQDV